MKNLQSLALPLTILMAAVGSVFLTMLAGCGCGGGGGTPATPTPTASATPTPTPTPTPSPTASPTPTPIPVVVGITPNAKTVSVGDTIPFTASVSGAEDQAVVWSIEEGSSGGAITADGLYTAPVLPGTFHVVAIRSADTTHTATATITVQAGDVTGVIQ